MMDLVKRVEEVKDRSDLVVVIRELLEDLRNAPQGWENTTLPLYLDALAAWIEDMDGFFHHRGEGVTPTQPTWKLVAQMLLAASMYE